MKDDDLKPVILTISGVLGFSPLSEYVSHLIIAGPTLNEILLLPFYLYLANTFKIRNISIVILPLLIFWVALIAISLANGEFETYAILSTARGYLYIIVFFALFINKNIVYQDLGYILLGSVLGWAAMSMKLMYEIFINHNLDHLLANGNMIALAALTAYLVSGKANGTKYKLISIFAISTVLLFAGSRRAMLVVFAALFVSMLAYKRVGWKSIIIITFISSIFVLNFNNLESFLEQEAPQIKFRMIDKVSNIGDNAGDEHRIDLMLSALNMNGQDLIPLGYVSKQTEEMKEAGDMMDFPIAELIHTFGAILLLIFSGSYIVRIIQQVKTLTYRNWESGITITVALIMGLLAFIEGSFLNFTFTSPITGFYLARLYTKNEGNLRRCR